MGLRQRRSVTFGVLVLAGASLALGCGDEEPAKDQTVFWMQLSTSAGQQCSSTASLSLPDETARSVIIGNGQGDRLVDGDDDVIVQCSVAPAATADQFNVSFDLSGGAVASFSVRGTVNKVPNVPGTGSLDIDIATSQFALNQDDCAATVEEALGGALWVSNLSCPSLRDPSSPAVECTGTGGFIIENCSR
jgi:hypothetical protein